MDDAEILGRINELAREQHDLFAREAHGSASEADRARLRQLEVALDQSWDLLRQWRARRSAGLDPSAVRVRDEATLRGYSG